MSIILTDDGTLDTVLRCTECGEEFRGNYDSIDVDEPEVSQDAEGYWRIGNKGYDGTTGYRSRQAAEDAYNEQQYNVWVDDFITEVESEHECPATPLPDDLHRNDDGTYPARTSLGYYPIHYYTADGGRLCADCANGKNCSDANHYTSDPQWRLVASDVYWEGPVVCCDHCNAEMESAYGDPDAEPTEPAEDDITTEDHRTFYQNGRLVLEQSRTINTPDYLPTWFCYDRTGRRLLGSFGDDHVAAVRAYMDRVQFWPNCWFISDHGNAHLMNLATPEGK